MLLFEKKDISKCFFLKQTESEDDILNYKKKRMIFII